eukprot:3501057-Prymnesium_polylepis.1
MAEKIEAAHTEVMAMGGTWPERKKNLIALWVAKRALPYGFDVVKGEAKCAANLETIHALKLLAAKAPNFERPVGVARYTQEAKPDGRGLAVLAALDGTNKTESTWQSMQTTLSAHSYSKDSGHGYLMAAANRLSMKGETMMLGVPSYGFYDQQLQRDTNEI